jgi:hypothetical protein
MRPALFGHLFNELFILLPLAGLVLLYIVLGYRIVVAQSKLVLLGITAAFLGWVFFQILMLDPGGAYDGFVIVVTIPAVVIGCILLITNSDAELVLKAIVVVMTLLSVSQLVTYGLFFLGFERSILIMERYIYDYVASPLKLYFPYTFTLHNVGIAGHKLERAGGLFREPGLYQLFIVTSYFALDFIRVRRKNLLRGLFIFSLLTTFSAAGYVMFVGCLVYKNLFIRRGRWPLRLVSLVVVGGMFLAFASVPFWGLNDKMSRNVGRISSPIISWEFLLQKPISGYSITAEQPVFSGAGVSLLTSLHKLSFVGLCLYLGLILYAVHKHYTLQTLVLLLPVLGTLLMSQPLYEKAFTFFMLFLFTRNLLPLEGERRGKRKPSQRKYFIGHLGCEIERPSSKHGTA